MYPPFEIRQLYYFVTVVEEGQITRAAARLHMAQPALSQTIAKLEATVGVRLLERQSRGVALTPAGVAFFEKARAAVTAAQEAATILGPYQRAEGALVVGFTANLHPAARPILRAFVQAHPDVEVRVEHISPPRRLLDLRAGLIDAELLLAPDAPEPGLVVETVVRSPRHVLLSSSHPLAGESQLTFDQISGETFPGLHPGIAERWAVECWLSERRGRDPKLTQEKPLTLDELWALIQTGRAIDVLPHFMVRPMVGNGVCSIPLVGVDPFEFALARRADDTRAVLADLFEIARDLAARGEGAGDEPDELLGQAEGSATAI